MKIIHSLFSFTVGGIESMLVDIMNRQCESASVDLIIVNDKIDNDLLSALDKRITVFLLKRKESNKLQLLQTFFRINKIINHRNPNVIHCHDYNLFPFFILWKRKICLTAHSINLPVSYLKQYRKIFAISAAVQKNIKDRIELDVEIVYNGIEIEQYKSRNNYHFDPENEFKIIQLGRLFPVIKGQHIAIKSLSLLLQKHPEMRIRLFFAGAGEGLDELKQMVRNNNLCENVVFLGLVNRSWVKTNLNNYQLLIQPSLFEGFGLTVIEGFASGLPVVASNIDGPKEILNKLQSGLVAEPNNPEDLAEKIYKVYNSYLSENILETNYLIKDKSRLKLFDMQTTVQCYWDCYQKYFDFE